MVINSNNPRCSKKNPDYVYYKNMRATCQWWDGGEFLPIEVSIGIYFGFRIGFNFGETLEFFEGLLGFDPYEDDYDSNGILHKRNDSWQERGLTKITTVEEKGLPKPVEVRDWESKLDALDEKMDKRVKK